MKVYVSRSYEPTGGFYSGAMVRLPPAPLDAEIREVDDFPDAVWDDITCGRVEMGEDGTLDQLWIPWYNRGTTIWRRT